MKSLYVILILLLSVVSYGDDYRKICNLVSLNDSVALEPLLENKNTVQLVDKNNRTLLFCAAKTGADKTTKLLLEKGIDPNKKDKHQKTVIPYLIESEYMSHYSTGHKQEYNFIQTAMFLMKFGADTNIIDEYGNSLLMKTGTSAMMRLLLAYGADVNHKNKYGMDALLNVAGSSGLSKKKRMELITILLEHGANLKSKDNKGKDLLQYLNYDFKYTFFKHTGYPKSLDQKTIKNYLLEAMKEHDHETIETLLKMENLSNATGYYNKPLVFHAIKDSKSLEVFFNYGLDVNIKSKRRTLLQEAIDECAVDSVKLILEHDPKDFNNFQTISTIMNCKEGNKSIEIAELLFKKGVKPSVTDKLDHTLLHLAAKKSNDTLCQYFLDKGLSVDVKDKEDATPIVYALTSRKNDLCAKILLKAGADIHQKGPENITLLHIAVKRNHSYIVRYLLDKGIDPNETDKQGHNAMQLAAKNVNFSILNLLLQKGANLKAIDEEGNGVLHYACRWDGSISMVKFLIEKGLDINLKNKLGETALMVAVRNGNLAIVSYLMENGANINIQDNNGNSLLHHALKKTNKEMVVLLLLKGVDKNIKNKEGFTASDSVDKMAKYNIETYKKLLTGNFKSFILDSKNIFSAKSLDKIVLYTANGGKMDIKNNKGQSLLHTISQKYGKENIVDYLLALGVDVNQKDSEGRTALHVAAQFSNDATVKTLLQHGADINAKDNNNLTAVDYLIMDISKRKNYILPILKIMFEHGLTSIPSKNSKGESLLYELSRKSDLVAFLIEHGLDVNEQNEDGDSPLVACAVHNYYKSAQVLLDAGANIDYKNKRGRTALYIATKLRKYETAQVLLDNGAHPDLQTKNGDTLLMNAVRANDMKMISLLLGYNSNPNVANDRNDTALHMAVMNANYTIVKALLDKKADVDKVNDIGLSALDYARELKLSKILPLLESLSKADKKSIVQNTVPKKVVQKTVNDTVESKPSDINNKYMQTQLHEAARSGNLTQLNEALNSGIEVNVVDTLGRTPLHYAAFSGYVSIANILLGKGADINAVDRAKQWTPLFFAVYMHQKEMIKLLIERGADQTLKDKLGKTADDYKKDR